jgi:hypothetical protein
MAFIQDSYYYQNMSYEIKSSADVQHHITSLNDLLGIAGMKMFAKSILQETTDSETNTEIIFA